MTPAPCCYAIGFGGHHSRRIGGKESFRKDEYENEECSHTPRRVDGGGGPTAGAPALQNHQLSRALGEGAGLGTWPSGPGVSSGGTLVAASWLEGPDDFPRGV